MGNAVFKPNAMTTPISQMGPWAFWSRIEACGLDAELERAVLASGGHGLTEDQKHRLQLAANAAKEALTLAEPYVPYVRPS